MADSNFGLKIHPAAILRSLLQQYPSGGQFFCEALQNADDTGRATKCCALLDLRRHPMAKLRPPAIRKDLQGESIMFYDDAGFKDRDWRSLQFMCDSQKRDSPYESGTFGMGSRSFFHITDVLQILSRKKLAFLDPDDILETGHFGEQLAFMEGDWLEKYPDEAAPFMGVFGCDMKKEFEGTIIRAALRSEERSQTCSFTPEKIAVSRAERIFAEFEDTLKNGEVILFLNRVTQVGLWRWDDGAAQPTCLATASLGVSSGHSLPKKMSAPGVIRTYLEQFSTFAKLETALLKPDAAPPEILDVVDLTIKFGDKPEAKRQWLRYGMFSRDLSLVKHGISCGCVPLVSLALPFAHQMEGCFFTSLPLPLTIGLPLHVNAHFRLHSNRRAMWRSASDLEGEHKTWGEWNEKLLTTMVPEIYAKALHWLAKTPGIATDGGLSMWPKESDLDQEYTLMFDPLVRAVKDIDILPLPDGKRVKPVDAVYFPTPTDALRACREELLQLCLKGGLKVVDPPDHVVDLLHGHKALTKKSCEWILSDVVLPAAKSMDKAKLAKLLLAYCDWASAWKETEMRTLGATLAGVGWVPTENGGARAINCCFDPENSPEALTIVQENRATIAALTANSSVDAEAVWRVFRLCGLKSEITWEDAVEEAEALVMAKDVSRAGHLFTHIDKQHPHLKGNKDVP